MAPCPNCGKEGDFLASQGKWFCVSCEVHYVDPSDTIEVVSEEAEVPEQADTTQEQEDTAPEQMDTALEQEDTASEEADTAQEQGDTAPNQSDAPREEVDTARQQTDTVHDLAVTARQQAAPFYPIWFQNFYRIRKKMMALGKTYWIEDIDGRILGFSKSKFLKLKEDIRIYSDESMSRELFIIKQTQIVDDWGSFAIIDSDTEIVLGFIKRRGFSSHYVWNDWDIYDADRNHMGGIHESEGRGLLRNYLPMGNLIPEKMTLMLEGAPIAEINQKFNVFRDEWEMNCINVPERFDRRVLLGGMLLMGMIENKRK